MDNVRILVSTALLASVLGCSLGRPPSIAEPAFLEQYARTHRFTQGRPRSVTISPDGSAVLFLRSSPQADIQNLYEMDVDTANERLLLSAEKLLQGGDEHLSIEERARRERMRLSARGIASYQLSKDGRLLLVPLSDRLFVVERASDSVTELRDLAGYPLDARLSPNGKLVAYVADGELYIINIATGESRQLTDTGGGTITNALAEFVAQEEMGRRRGYWFAPDSQTIAYQQTDTSGVEIMHILDTRHPQRTPQSWPYPRTGGNNAQVRLGLVSTGGGETTWIEWDRAQYPYLATVRWEDSAPLTLVVQNREQTEELLLTVDTQTGATSTLWTEHDDAWLNLDQRMPHWFEDGSAFLWTTERNGWWQLELHDRSGELLTTLTSTDFRFKRFVYLDDDTREVYVLGGNDPTQTQIFRVPFGKPGQASTPHAPIQLTYSPGLHEAQFCEDGSVYLHTFSGRSGEQQQVLRRKDGTQIAQLNSLAAQPPFVPNLELTTVGESPRFYAALIRPGNFERRQRYPVLVNIYGCPKGQMATANARRYLLQQWIADHGCIVVSIDARGTPWRGRAWERITKGELSTIPLTDQVNVLKALGNRYRELDLTRVGIYGWSGGGYFSAMAAMRRPDIFDAAIAGAPVADWHDYDTHYTERFMGLPADNPEGYRIASVLTYADQLEVPLLLIHGTTDDNVYFMHSQKISDALFRAGKHHEFLPLSGFTHMVRDPAVTIRLYTQMMEFFQRHVFESR